MRTRPDCTSASLALSVSSSSAHRARKRSGWSISSGNRPSSSSYNAPGRSSSPNATGERSGSANAAIVIDRRAALRDVYVAKSPAAAMSMSRSRRAGTASGLTSAYTDIRPSWSKWLFDTNSAEPCRSNRSRYAIAIWAERSAAKPCGATACGQCDKLRTVPSVGAPSTMTFVAPAMVSYGTNRNPRCRMAQT